MSRTLTALFENRADADAARQRLAAANIDVSNVHLHDQKSEGFSSTAYSSDENRGFWNKLSRMFLPEEDRHTYEEGVRRGGVMVTADVEADQAEQAARLLEQDSVDIDRRASEWRQAGWNYTPTAAAATTRPAPVRADAAHGTDEQRIPLVEERLAVGKREVDRGSVRVRSYVVETPVKEQVSLRNESVSVDRRPVDRAVGVGEDAFRERTIAMQARGEEAVVSKQAHVREEVVVRKDASERNQTIEDKVRHTEVEIDKGRADAAVKAEPARKAI